MKLIKVIFRPLNHRHDHVHNVRHGMSPRITVYIVGWVLSRGFTIAYDCCIGYYINHRRGWCCLKRNASSILMGTFIPSMFPPVKASSMIVAIIMMTIMVTASSASVNTTYAGSLFMFAEIHYGDINLIAVNPNTGSFICTLLVLIHAILRVTRMMHWFTGDYQVAPYQTTLEDVGGVAYAFDVKKSIYYLAWDQTKPNKVDHIIDQPIYHEAIMI